jgi:hypothetical protein
MGRRHKQRRLRRAFVFAVLVIVLLAVVALLYFTQSRQEKPIILYVNQGNGVVNGSNFQTMLYFASSHGFNTVFFQIYRQGVLLFSASELGSFVNETHADGQKIFFALYITNSSQTIPGSIFGLGEDGVNLDMSTLNVVAQENLLADLKGSCHCQTAVTTTDMTSTLAPDLLILETYSPALQQYIRQDVIGSVGVFATSSRSDYESQFQYALDNGEGVMVFDYAGLLKSGY